MMLGSDEAGLSGAIAMANSSFLDSLRNPTVLGPPGVWQRLSPHGLKSGESVTIMLADEPPHIQRRMRNRVSGSAHQQWSAEMLGKSPAHRLRWGLAQYESFFMRRQHLWDRRMFEVSAYRQHPEEALRTGLVVAEVPEWFRGPDGKLEVMKWQAPDGTIHERKSPVVASGPAYAAACDAVDWLVSFLTDTVREIAAVDSALVPAESALGQVCKRDGFSLHEHLPAWAGPFAAVSRIDGKDRRIEGHAGGSFVGWYSFDCGDCAVMMYWPQFQKEAAELVIKLDGRSQALELPPPPLSQTVTKPSAAERAWRCHDHAIAEATRLDTPLTTDSMVYEWLCDNEWGDERPWTLETFTRHLREHRRLTGQQKNHPRAGRGGRGTVKGKGI